MNREKSKVNERVAQLGSICLERRSILIDQEFDELSKVSEIYELMRWIAPMPQERHSIGRSEAGAVVIKVGNKALLKNTQKCFQYLDRINDGYFANYEFSPRVGLFTSTCNDSGHLDLDRRNITNDKVEILIERIRAGATSRDFDRRLRNFEEGPFQNVSSVHNYIRGLQALHGTLTFVRLELSLSPPEKKQNSKLSGNEIVVEPESDKNADGAAKDVRIILKSMLNEVLNSISKIKHKAGYIWKLDYRQDSLFRVHLFLIFEGIETAEMIETANKVGHQWESKCPIEGAKFLNCHELSEDVLLPLMFGWGTMSVDDQNGQREIKQFFRNMLLRDRYLKLKINGFKKTYDRGKL